MGGSGKQESGSAVRSDPNNSSGNLHNSDSGATSQKAKGKGKAAAAALALKKALDNKANQNNPNHPSYYSSRGKNAQKKEKKKVQTAAFAKINSQPPDRVVDLRKPKFAKAQFQKKNKVAAFQDFTGPRRKKLNLRAMVHKKLKHPFQLLCRTVKLKEAFHQRYFKLGKSPRTQILERRRKALGIAIDGIHKLEFSLAKKVEDFKKAAKEEKKFNIRNFRANMSKDQMLNGIIRDLEEDKIFENKVAYMYLCAILDPERFKNVGIPDSYNGSRSGKPTIITEYIVPFDAAGETAVVVSDDPLQHITVLKGGTASQALEGPNWVNENGANGQSNKWNAVVDGDAISATSPSYAVTGQTTTFNVYAGSDQGSPVWFDDENQPIILETATVADASKLTYTYLPLVANDTFRIYFATPDTTMNGFTATIQTIIDSGSGPATSSQGPTNITGGAVFTGQGYIEFTLAANTIGVRSYSIANTLAGTDATPGGYLRAAATKALGTIILPCGKANGEDVNFLIDYCDEYRSGPCSVKSTYYGGYLDNGLIIQGQLPKDDDFVLPPPSVQNWGLIPGVITKALNDPTDPGAYCPMFRRDYSSSMWDKLDGGDEDSPSHEQVIVYAVANGASAEFVRIRTALQFQYRTEVQSVYTDEGVVDQGAIDLITNWLSEAFNGYTPVFGNCDHEDKCDRALKAFEKERGGNSYSFFNGWFSGNETKLSNDGEIIV